MCVCGVFVCVCVFECVCVCVSVYLQLPGIVFALRSLDWSDKQPSSYDKAEKVLLLLWRLPQIGESLHLAVG